MALRASDTQLWASNLPVNLGVTNGSAVPQNNPEGRDNKRVTMKARRRAPAWRVRVVLPSENVAGVHFVPRSWCFRGQNLSRVIRE